MLRKIGGATFQNSHNYFSLTTLQFRVFALSQAFASFNFLKRMFIKLLVFSIKLRIVKYSGLVYLKRYPFPSNTKYYFTLLKRRKWMRRRIVCTDTSPIQICIMKGNRIPIPKQRFWMHYWKEYCNILHWFDGFYWSAHNMFLHPV